MDNLFELRSRPGRFLGLDVGILRVLAGLYSSMMTFVSLLEVQLWTGKPKEKSSISMDREYGSSTGQMLLDAGEDQ